MARMVEEICTYALGEYRHKGFKAWEESDHTLVLEHNRERIAELNAGKVTLEKLQQVCHQHLNEDILLGKHGYPKPHGEG